MKPWAFKVRGGGNATGVKGGQVKAGIAGGVGALYSQDTVFTIATHQDQWIATPPLTNNNYEYTAPIMTTPQVPLRYLSVCSGMEAASVAWEPLGWKPVGFSEIDEFPKAILKHHFTQPNYPYDVPNFGSLTEYQSWPIEPGTIDLLVGGTPCQSFSVAGLRKGLEDPRGNLALVFLGLADRIKPRWIVWENVPGVLSSAGGRDFGSFLGALVELGYGFAYRVLDAQHFRGTPQRRRRVFVVAYRDPVTGLGDWHAPAKVLLESDCVRRDIKKGRAKRKGAAADAGAGVEAGGGCWWDGGQVSQTLDAVLAKGQTMPEKNRFPAVLQPKPIVIDRAAFNQGENAQYDPHIAESDVMDSLVARGPHAVGQPIPIQDGRDMDKNQNGMGVGNPGDPAYTLDTTGAQAAAIPFRKSKRAQSKTDDESWVEGEVSNTLNNFDLGDTRTTHAVVHCSDIAPTVTSSGPPYSRTGNERVEAEALAVTFQPHIVQASELRLRGQITEKSVCPTLTAGAKQGDTDPLAVHAVTFQPGNLRREAGADPSFTTTTTLKASAGDQTPHVAIPPMAVRRLTPVECERLQGFPDNWSRIPWKGKPAEQCPDGPRYKACGNSMAVPVMRWIGERIAMVEAAKEGKDQR